LRAANFREREQKGVASGISINYLEFEAIEIRIADSLPQSKKLSRAAIAQPVLKDLLKIPPGGHEFANKADCGDKHSGECVVGGASRLTKIYAPTVKLPRTGYRAAA
jgi:hypothetical protein